MINKKIDCRLCGKLLGNLNMHIKHIHKITSLDYKARFPGAILSYSWSTGLTKETSDIVHKMSNTLKGHKYSEERNNKVRIAHTGRKRPLEWKEAIRQGELKYYKNNPEVGKERVNAMLGGLRKMSSGKMNTPESILFTMVENIGGMKAIHNFQVGLYRIDVALPNLKIGFECDGENWHKDKVKDVMRDLNIYKRGWKIFRFPSQVIIKDLKRMEREVKEILYPYYELEFSFVEDTQLVWDHSF